MRAHMRVMGWLCLGLMSYAVAAPPDCSRGKPDPRAVAQVISIQGSAVFASDHDRLMSEEGARRAKQRSSTAASTLKVGQWLRAGQAVLAFEDSVVRLRWRDGGEQQLGPSAFAVETTVRPLHIALPAAPIVSALSIALHKVRAFEHRQRPWLLLATGSILALLPLLRRKPYHPGWPARLLAIALLAFLMLPVSLLLAAAQLGRTSWYQFPLTGETWSGSAAGFAHAANIGAFIVVSVGLISLWWLALAFATGGGERLAHRASGWWICASAALIVFTTAYGAPYASNVDYASAWYRQWQDWARYYALGTWLLPMFALLVACSRPASTARRWQRAAASAVLIAFVACYAIGYARDCDPRMNLRAGERASRVEALRSLCGTPNVFTGTASNFRIANQGDCTPRSARIPGDLSGTLQACETAQVDVLVDQVLHSATLQPGQRVTFALAHARLPLDSDNGLAPELAGQLLFQTHEDTDGTHVPAAQPGTNRFSELGFSNAGNAIYARGVLAECSR